MDKFLNRKFNFDLKNLAYFCYSLHFESSGVFFNEFFNFLFCAYRRKKTWFSWFFYKGNILVAQFFFFSTSSSFHFSSFRLPSYPIKFSFFFFPTQSSFHSFLSNPIKFSFFFFGGWFVIWKYKHMVAAILKYFFLVFWWRIVKWWRNP